MATIILLSINLVVSIANLLLLIFKKGPQGPRGFQGPQGPQGPRGGLSREEVLNIVKYFERDKMTNQMEDYEDDCNK